MLKLLLKSVTNSLIALVYPDTCIFCGKIFNTDSTIKICGACKDFNKAEVKSQFCFLCYGNAEGENGLCSSCRQILPYIDRLGAMWKYKGVYRYAVINLKFHTKIENAATLGILIAEHIKKMGFNNDIDIIIPVPLHSSKKRERGFNQAALIAHKVGKILKITVDKRTLKRIRKTLPQMNLDKAQRQTNIEGAMKAVSPQNISGKNILLIDDIFTSGSTLNECAKALKEQGAARVSCFAVCY